MLVLSLIEVVVSAVSLLSPFTVSRVILGVMFATAALLELLLVTVLMMMMKMRLDVMQHRFLVIMVHMLLMMQRMSGIIGGKRHIRSVVRLLRQHRYLQVTVVTVGVSSGWIAAVGHVGRIGLTFVGQRLDSIAAAACVTRVLDVRDWNTVTLVVRVTCGGTFQIGHTHLGHDHALHLRRARAYRYGQ